MTSTNLSGLPDTTNWIICSYLSDEDLRNVGLTNKAMRESFSEAARVDRSEQIRDLAKAIISTNKTTSDADKAFLERFTKANYDSKERFPTLLAALFNYHIDRSLILARLLTLNENQLIIINEKLLQERLPPLSKAYCRACNMHEEEK